MNQQETQKAENKTVKFQMMLSPSETTLLDEYRWANRLKSRAEALRILMGKGLEAVENEKTA